MSTEVVKKESMEVETFEGGEWGAGSNIAQEDLIVGKVLLMQPQSRPVIKKQAEMGEMRSSLDNSVLNKKDGTLDVVIFYQDKVWIVFEGDEKNTEWKETFLWEPSNAKLPWSEKIGSKSIHRQKALNFYALILNDDSLKGMPVIIRMKGMSYGTGKRLTTLFGEMRNNGKPSAACVITLNAYQDENDKGVFYVWDFKQGRETTKEEQMIAYKWFVGARKAQMKVDESDMVEGDEETPSAKTSTVKDDEVDFL